MGLILALQPRLGLSPQLPRHTTSLGYKEQDVGTSLAAQSPPPPPLLHSRGWEGGNHSHLGASEEQQVQEEAKAGLEMPPPQLGGWGQRSRPSRHLGTKGAAGREKLQVEGTAGKHLPRPLPPLPGWVGEENQPGVFAPMGMTLLFQHPLLPWSWAENSGIRALTIRLNYTLQPPGPAGSRGGGLLTPGEVSPLGHRPGPRSEWSDSISLPGPERGQCRTVLPSQGPL